MRIVWVSPACAGIDLLQNVRNAGHAVVAYGSDRLPLDHGIPRVQQAGLAQACRVADLVVVDGPHPAERTVSSWRPSPDALFFDELRRHHRVTALGPTPTVDLLVADARYLRKMCRRFGVPYDSAAEGEPWSSGAWFKSKEIIPPSPYVVAFAPLFKSVGFRGYFELTGVLTSEGPVVTGASAEWPAEAIPTERTAEFLQRLAA